MAKITDINTLATNPQQNKMDCLFETFDIANNATLAAYNSALQTALDDLKAAIVAAYPNALLVGTIAISVQITGSNNRITLLQKVLKDYLDV